MASPAPPEAEKASIPLVDAAPETNTAAADDDDQNAAVPEKEDWEVQRDEHKTSGDSSFRSRDYKAAVVHYTHALSVDPANHIILSNRSAAYLANGEKSKALADARECVKADADFVKGHSRLAAAMMALGRWSEARAAYGTVLSKDKGNAAALKGVEDCRNREREVREREMESVKAEMERTKKAKEAEAAAKAEKEAAKKKVQEEEEAAKTKKQDGGTTGGGGGGGGEDDDLLDDFFSEVETATTKKKEQPKPEVETGEGNADGETNDGDGSGSGGSGEKKIQVELTDLGTSTEQIDRLLGPNSEWKNLNPFFVLAVPHDTPPDVLSRRYKALSLLLHPDKCPDSRSKDAFEQVRRAMNALGDEDKARHTRALVERGMKQGKRDFEQNRRPGGGDVGDDEGSGLAAAQDKAVMKIFAEIERSRREIERRKRAQEKREREQEDEETRKAKKERDFHKKWREEDRVEKRIGNWRDFQGGDSGASKKQKKSS